MRLARVQWRLGTSGVAWHELGLVTRHGAPGQDRMTGHLQGRGKVRPALTSIVTILAASLTSLLTWPRSVARVDHIDLRLTSGLTSSNTGWHGLTSGCLDHVGMRLGGHKHPVVDIHMSHWTCGSNS